MSIAAVCLCLLGLALGASSASAASSTTLTSAASDATLGGPIHDSATLAGGNEPFGSMTFRAYAPGDVGCATPVFTRSVRVAGNRSYESPSFTPSVAGEYRWTASFPGDPNNEPSASACGAPGATSNVARRVPTLASAATDAPIGGTVTDTVTLGNAGEPGGTIAFEAFGPGDLACEHPVVFRSMASVSGDGDYESEPFTPDEAGEYSWRVTYYGDGRNAEATTGCGGTGGVSTVTKVTPTISTAASGSIAGAPTHATATIGGGHDPRGMVTFRVYGPDPTGCSGAPAAVSFISVEGDGAYDSLPFTPSAAGEYRWTAFYYGDGNNEAVTSDCEATVTVGKASPTISTVAATDAALGRPVHDTAALAGGSGPGGTILFQAYGPGDTTCSGPVALTATVPVHGDGSYGSGDLTPAAIGRYRWTAAYSGDANDEPASTACEDPSALSTVTRAETSLTTAASNAPVGTSLHVSTRLAGGLRAGGTVTFAAFGPGDADCSGPAVFQESFPVNGNGEYDSGGFAPTAPGDYRWVVNYSGDAENMPVTGACGGAGETSAVSPSPSPSPPVTAPAEPAPPAQPAPSGPLGTSSGAGDGSSSAMAPVTSAASPPPALGAPAACRAPAAPKRHPAGSKKRRRPVPGVGASIRVPSHSVLELRTTLRFRRGGHPRTAKLARAWLAAPGKQKLRLAIPARLRRLLPVGTRVRLSVLVSTSPAAGLSCAAPRRSRLHFTTKVAKIRLPR